MGVEVWDVGGVRRKQLRQHQRHRPTPTYYSSLVAVLVVMFSDTQQYVEYEVSGIKARYCGLRNNVVVSARK
jgi:hypothetical protein